MATFKVGQRVRVRTSQPVIDPECLEVNGREGVIVRASEGNFSFVLGAWWVVRVPGASHSQTELASDEFCIHEAALEPLTDPKADEFIERIKKLGNEPMPLVKEPIRA